MSPIALILALVAAYLALGVLFSLAFLTRGITTIDHASRGSSPAFRLLILPAVAALWPVLAVKWRRARATHAHAGDAP
ncbi:MAG: hypothetical protein R3B57_06845 [Phycisphaerales bacterium]